MLSKIIIIPFYRGFVYLIYPQVRFYNNRFIVYAFYMKRKLEYRRKRVKNWYKGGVWVLSEYDRELIIQADTEKEIQKVAKQLLQGYYE